MNQESNDTLEIFMTHANRMDILINKIIKVDSFIAQAIDKARISVPSEIFAMVFAPIKNEFDKRLEILADMAQATQDLEDSLKFLKENNNGK